LRPLRHNLEIQRLRGVAVLLVLIFHAFPSFLPGGYLGVDIFFVISGFVVGPKITKIFDEKSIVKTELIDFYKRRIYRLSPALGVTTLISSPLVFLFGNINDHKRFYQQALSGILFVANFTAEKLSGDYFNPRPNPFIHTWSLSAEEQIYLLLPIILCICMVLFKTNILIGFPNLTLILIFSIFILSYQFLNIFYNPFFRTIEFLIGYVCAILKIKSAAKQEIIAKFYFKYISWISIFLLVSLCYINSSKFSTQMGILASLFTAMVILTNAIPKSNNLYQIGNWSYSIYLVHMPIIYLLNFSPFLEFQSSQRKILINIFGLFSSIMLGKLQYRFIKNVLDIVMRFITSNLRLKG
jgi:peptidoglycan/LPS O-acetylase OafA/YrhL